jgi:hypothetical protein
MVVLEVMVVLVVAMDKLEYQVKMEQQALVQQHQVLVEVMMVLLEQQEITSRVSHS